jgi:sulfur-oxidizing protein SoxZ
MANRIKIRALQKNGVTEVKALMRHPMETGQRRDDAGEVIPAHFITEVVATHGDRVVMEAHWGAAVSQNPLLGFRFQGGQVGDTVTVTWIDNRGQRGEGQAVIR